MMTAIDHSPVTKIYKVGVQLHQVGTKMKGKPLGSGGIVHETEEAIKAEMAEAWRIMRDEERYGEFKKNIKDLRGVIDESCTSGKAKSAVDAIVAKYLS